MAVLGDGRIAMFTRPGQFKALADNAEQLKEHLRTDLNSSGVTAGAQYEKHIAVLRRCRDWGPMLVGIWRIEPNGQFPGQWRGDGGSNGPGLGGGGGFNPSGLVAGLGVTNTAGGYISPQLHSTNGPDPSLDWAGANPSVVDVTQEISFYHAVLAIHGEDYSRALQLIESARATLVPVISSVLNESYTRAYRAMISMQVMAGWRSSTIQKKHNRHHCSGQPGRR